MWSRADVGLGSTIKLILTKLFPPTKALISPLRINGWATLKVLPPAIAGNGFFYCLFCHLLPLQVQGGFNG